MTNRQKVGISLVILGAVAFLGSLVYLMFSKVYYDLRLSEEFSLAFKLSPLFLSGMLAIYIGVRMDK